MLSEILQLLTMESEVRLRGQATTERTMKMLFDTLKKKKQAEQAQQDWAANRPADYESANTADMDALTGQIGSGFDWDTASDAYQQYRTQSAANASDAAANAAANAAALSGGYGSSYADSAAKQGWQQAMGTIDNALPNLKSQAQSEYRNGQNSLLTALAGMANTEALDRSAYGANLANYESKANALANESAQARNENDNFWNNLWNGLKVAGNVAQTAYDGYKGYTYQEAQLAMQKQAAQQQALQTALNLRASGGDELAKAVLTDAGLDASLLDNYNGRAMTWEDKLSGLQTAETMRANGDVTGSDSVLKILGQPVDSISTRDEMIAPTWKDQLAWLPTGTEMAASGDDAGKNTGLKILGLPATAVSDYQDLADKSYEDYRRKANLDNTLAIQKSYATKTGGSGRRSGSGSSGNTPKSKSTGDSWTNAQLRQLASDYNKMTDSNELKPYYRQVLTEHGWLGASGQAAEPAQNTKQLTGNTLLQNPGAKWVGGTGNSGSSGNSGNTQKTNVDRLVQGYAKKGYSAWAIANLMSGQGYTDAEIAAALEKAGVQ